MNRKIIHGDRVIHIREVDGVMIASTALWLGDNEHIANQMMSMATQNLGMVINQVKSEPLISKALNRVEADKRMRNRSREVKQSGDPLKALISDAVREGLCGRGAIIEGSNAALWRCVAKRLSEGPDGALSGDVVAWVDGLPDDLHLMAYSDMKGINVRKVIQRTVINHSGERVVSRMSEKSMLLTTLYKYFVAESKKI
jgi:hypothetical protein